MIVHVIVNSHLDPVWLWKREQGIDEVLSTGRTACDLLDRYPELIITRGEAWFYEIIEKYAPDTFGRIREHVAAGRWKIVGGWYIQPDCNLASPETYRKHGEIGCAYFRKKFGVTVQTGYNVDSFGHGAMLPSFYRSAGIRNYVYMRPMKHEMTLPANDFIWRAPDGSEVLASRILTSYATWNRYLAEHIEDVLAQANPKIGHVMCFYGVGDHGGGPFRHELDWLLEHRNDYPGVEFRFSHPDAYFDAVRASGVKLPILEGGLQHHAIGCYSAVSRIKREVRKTENMLTRMEHFLPTAERREIWKPLLFSTFHDLLAGSSIQNGYADIYDSLGAVRHTLYEAFLEHSRKRTLQLPPAKRQRIIFDNTDAHPFHGFVTFQPSLIEGWLFGTPVSFFDPSGKPHPAQQLPTEESSAGRYSFLIPMKIAGRSRRILELDYGESKAPVGSVVCKDGKTLCNETTSVCLDKTGITSLKRNGVEFLAASPDAVVIPDPSDTWSHSINSFPGEPDDRFRLRGTWKQTISGSYVSEMAISSADRAGSTMNWFARLCDGIPGLNLQLRMNWHETQKLVKLIIRPSFKVVKRTDGISGGVLNRKLNGEEYPVFNRITLSGRNHSLTVVAANVFSADVQPDGTLRLTLLRSPYYAHHDPEKVAPFTKSGVTDQGEIDFTVALLPDASEDEIAEEILRQSEPVYCSETTFGILR